MHPPHHRTPSAEHHRFVGWRPVRWLRWPDSDSALTPHTHVAPRPNLFCLTWRVPDYDRVLVMDKGRVVEFDSPATLLSSPDGAFSKMVSVLAGAASKEQSTRAASANETN